MKNIDISINKLTRLMGKKLSKNQYRTFQKKIKNTKVFNEEIQLAIKNNTIYSYIIRDKCVNTPKFYPNVVSDITIFVKTIKRIDSFQIDLKFLKKGFNTQKPYDNLVYSHISSDALGRGSYTNYHGITNQTMPVRFSQHEKADSNFGKNFRKYNEKVLAVHNHMVIADGLTRKEAFDLEEKVIKEHSLFRDGKGNNMIPGGIPGLRIAKRLGYKDRESAEIDLEEAANDDEKLANICSKYYNWTQTDEQIANIVCNNKNNFSKEEVRFIRICSIQIETILEIWKIFYKKYNYSMLNLGLKSRIEKVVNGESYRFVK